MLLRPKSDKIWPDYVTTASLYEIPDRDINETSVRIRKAAIRAKSETELQLEIEHTLWQ